ncbi:hypothetical protein ACUNFD_05705 [Serratia sp. IR-2025]
MSKKRTLVTIEDKAKGNVVVNIEGIGDFDAVKIKGNATDNFVSGVSVKSVDAITAIERIKAEIESLKIEENIKKETIQYLVAIRNSKNNDEASGVYVKMMGFISDHVTVFGAALPALMSIGQLFQ